MIYWICLSLVILLEMAGTISMKFSQGLTRWIPTVALCVLFRLSIAAMKLGGTGA